MPELPEVETVRRGLEPVMRGHSFEHILQRRDGLRFPFGKNFKRRLLGVTVQRLRRRAKYLVAELDTGDALVIHLGMSGRFSVHYNRKMPAETLGAYIYETGADQKHDHIVFTMSGGATIVYNDPRRFGFMQVLAQRELDQHPWFRALGVEPLGSDLTAEYLAAKAVGRKVSLKAFLMDQRTIAGLGNIYVCEALHRAGLSPKRSAACLATVNGQPTRRAIRLVEAIPDVLQKAVHLGGSTLRDHRKPDGDKGWFQETFKVYDRTGAPCSRTGCRGQVKRIVQQGRSTFYCSACQR